MKDQDKTKERLIKELSELRCRFSELKKEEKALLKNESIYKGMFDNTIYGVAVYKAIDNGKDFLFIDFNQAAEKIDNIKKVDVIGKSVVNVFPGIKKFGLFKIFQKVRLTGKAQHFPIRIYKDKRIVGWRENFVFKLSSGEIVAIYRDETARKQAEEALQRSNRALMMLSKSNEVLVRMTEEKKLLHQICRIVVQVGKYRLAWVGFAEKNLPQKIRPVAQMLFADNDLKKMDISWAYKTQFCNPAANAIQTREPVVCKNIRTNPNFTAWQPETKQFGFGSAIALPLIADGQTLGVLNIYAAGADDFNPDEVKLLKQLADDLAYGIVALRNRVHHRQTMQKLRYAMEATIQAIATAVELRDPYTAGHQKRVANLSVAIAKEMKLPEDQIEGIRMAGCIHDVGKLYVPAEILSKPDKLTEIEYSMAKFHVQAGYDILKGIDFPWPVTKIIEQHHERMNGTGYPNGLVGKDIIIEARILGVADVVLSMALHRPYRPALGIDAALEELEKNKDVLYDSDVVNACVKLFRKKQFKIN
ncbi:MAG: GAF domain-containing protein [Desulfobacterales bacterium]|nr:GAF domain-containing protein [Desulfobacterales bacterium]